jgi:hypothetical protein
VGGRLVVTGLKKAFSLDKFLDVLETSGLQMMTFVMSQNCNVTLRFKQVIAVSVALLVNR